MFWKKDEAAEKRKQEQAEREAAEQKQKKLTKILREKAEKRKKEKLEARKKQNEEEAQAYLEMLGLAEPKKPEEAEDSGTEPPPLGAETSPSSTGSTRRYAMGSVSLASWASGFSTPVSVGDYTHQFQGGDGAPSETRAVAGGKSETAPVSVPKLSRPV